MSESNLLSLTKKSLAIDDDDTTFDDLLTGFINAAQNQIKGSVGTDDGFYSQDSITDQYNSAVVLLASHWYLHRSAVSDSTKVETPLGLHYLLEDLKDSYREWEDTTTTTTTAGGDA